jgi:hypothetical protein
MFYVNQLQKERHNFIKAFLNKDETCPVAIVLAAVDFEWTLRRVILACGNAKSKDILNRLMHKSLNKYKKAYFDIHKENISEDEEKRHENKIWSPSGLDAYKKMWKQEINGVPLMSVLKNHEALISAFNVRNKIVHGVSVPIRHEYASDVTNNFLVESKNLAEKSKENGGDIFSKIDRRRPKNSTFSLETDNVNRSLK